LGILVNDGENCSGEQIKVISTAITQLFTVFKNNDYLEFRLLRLIDF